MLFVFVCYSCLAEVTRSASLHSHRFTAVTAQKPPPRVQRTGEIAPRSHRVQKPGAYALRGARYGCVFFGGPQECVAFRLVFC